jgi:HsdM N-terminal domain
VFQHLEDQILKKVREKDRSKHEGSTESICRSLEGQRRSNQSQLTVRSSAASKPSSGQPPTPCANNMDAAEYKHVVLGLIFLKYISDAFEAKHAELARRYAGNTNLA